MNLGLCEYYKDDPAKAADTLERGAALAPSHPRARVNRCIAKYFRGALSQAEAGFRSLLLDKPNDPEVTRLLADTCAKQGRLGEAIALFPTVPDTNPDRITLAELLCENEEFDRAVDLLRIVLGSEPDSQPACSQLAFALGGPIINRKNRKRLCTYAIVPQEEALLKEAAALSKRALEMAIAAGVRLGLINLYRNASAFAATAGQNSEAIRITQAGLDAFPDDLALLNNLFLTSHRDRRSSDAISAARRLAEIDPSEEGLAKLVLSLSSSGAFAEAVELLHERLSRDSRLRENPRIMAELIRATLGRNGPNAARMVFCSLSVILQRHPEPLLAYAHVEEKDGAVKAAQAAYEKVEAAALATEFEHMVAPLCGEFYYRTSQWKKALDRFVIHGQDPSLSLFAAEYLHCLYELNDFAAAVPFARALLARRWEPKPAEILGLSLLRLNQLPEAKEIFERIDRDVATATTLRRLASVYVRLAELPAARQLLERGKDQFQRDGKLLADLSRVCLLQRDFRAAATHAINASRLEPKSAVTEAALVQLLLVPGEALPGLKASDHRRIAKALAKAKGVRRLEFRTVDGVPDLTPMIELVRGRQLHVHHVLGLYRAQPLPITFIAESIGVPHFELWRSFTNGTVDQVWFCGGTHEEQQRDRQAIQDSNGICIEASSLFTLESLGQLELLERVFKRIIIPISVFEAIREERDLHTTVPRTGTTLHYHEGNLVRVDSNRDPASLLSPLSRIIDWIKDGVARNVFVLKGISANRVKAFPKRSFGKGIPQGVAWPIQEAHEEGVPLLTDDYGVRLLANHERLKTTSSLALLRVAGARRHISSDQFEKAVLALLELRYHYVSISSATVTRCLVENLALLSNTYLRVLQTLGASAHPAGTNLLALGCGTAWLDASGPTGPGQAIWVETHLTEVLRSGGNRIVLLWTFAIALGRTLMRHPMLATTAFRAVVASPQVLPHEKSVLVNHYTFFAAALSASVEIDFPHLTKTAAEWQARSQTQFYV